LTSTDGGSWTRLTLPTIANLRGAAFGAGTFVVLGLNETLTNSTIFSSSNGVVWTRRNPDSVVDMYNVIYAAGLFVAVGEGGLVIASTNGVDWTVRDSTAGHRLNSLTYGGGRFVAVGKKATIATSENGLDWHAQSYSYLVTKSTDFLQAIAYGNGLYVAGGQSGRLLISSNAADWTAPLSPFRSSYPSEDIEDLQFGNGIFIAVGSDGLIATSTNGVFWTRHYSGCGTGLRGAFYADGRFFAVGNNETILQSEPVGMPMLQAVMAPRRDGLEFSLNSAPTGPCRLQISANLKDWVDLFTFSNAQSTVSWRDTNVTANPRRFYRLVSP
jgi:hypothetical protein